MNTTTLKRLQGKIEAIKKKLLTIEDMRPGSLSKQYNVCGKPTCRCKDPLRPKKHGPYYNLSYTLGGRSRTEFVKKDQVKLVKKQIEAFRLFKKLTNQWAQLAWQVARLRVTMETVGNPPEKGTRERPESC
jgi:hypothetical protein